MFMNEWMDTGDIILQRETTIEPDDDALTVSHRLSTLGAKLLLETINHLKKGTLTSHPQDHSQGSYAPPLKKEDGSIDWTRNARDIHNQIRGTLPWPGTFTRFENKLLKIFKAEIADAPLQQPPGTIAHVTPDGIKVATGKGYLVLTEIQLENRRKMTATEFVKGNALPAGTLLG
jgi:methionyl-tRNA formyltransferase